MLREANAVGAKPFILFQYYLTWQNARGGIFPGLKTVADDLQIAPAAICNLRNVLIKAGWISVQNGRVSILKTFILNECHSDDMNADSDDMNKNSDNMNPLYIVSELEDSKKKEKEKLARQKRPKTAASLSPIETVFEYWKQTLNHPHAVLTKKRRNAVKSALIDYSVDDMKRAIDGCAVSPWHQGQNDRRMVYDDLELICRSGEKIEAFMGIYDRHLNGGLDTHTNGNGKTIDYRQQQKLDERAVIDSTRERVARRDAALSGQNAVDR